MIFDAFLAQLPNCVNREMIDNAAAEFCMNHNTKVYLYSFQIHKHQQENNKNDNIKIIENNFMIITNHCTSFLISSGTFFNIHVY